MSGARAGVGGAQRDRSRPCVASWVGTEGDDLLGDATARGVPQPVR
jgi:hypothetical protein